MIAMQPKNNNAPSSPATPWTRVRLIVTVLVPTLLVGLVAPGLMGQAHAQDSDGQRPGVIQRGGDDEDEDARDDQPQDEPDEDERPQPQDQGDEPDGDPEEEGQVITPENFDPNEEYNLPPNFDPDARPQRRPQNVKVTIDFRQAELEEVVKFFAGVMNKNFIISDSLQANKTITIISPEEVTLAQAYRAFVAALEMNGLTIVPFGNFLKIVEADKAISEPMNTYGEGERLPGEPRMVTAIVPVQNTPAEEMQDVISKFASQHASIIPYGSSLIITENAANLQRIRNLVKRLDEDEILEQVYVYEVQYAEAADIQEKLTELFDAEEGEGGNQPQANRRRRPAPRNQQKDQAGEGEGGDLNVRISQIMADERTNKLIIVANPRDFDKIRQMIELLDVPTAVGGQVHVKFLEYADAEELSSTLSNLTSGQNQQREQAQRAQRARQPQQQQAAGGDVAALLEGEVQVTSYKPNNALIVTASPKDFVALEQVVDMLDRPRRQVYVEAVIMEIGMDTDSELGMGFSAVNGQDFDGIIPDSAEESGIIDDTQGGLLGQSNFSPEKLAEDFGSGLGGSIGLVGPMANIPGTPISLPAFALTLRATQTDSSVNLLSAPTVMTMDNEEAEIVVADRIPFSRGSGGLGGLGSLAGLAGQQGQQGQQSGLGGLGALGGLGGGLLNNIEYEDVGITLRILPQVNESNFVRLEIDQEVSDIKSAGGEDLTPTTTKRTAKTVVLVEDQSTVVIGGLMKERDAETVQKVPFLGDIPVLGFLFRNKTTISTKQNLVLMLTPYIIEDKTDIKKVYDRKMKERDELAKLFEIDKKEYDPATNYQKKSGLVERMRDVLSEAEVKEKARQEAMEAFEDQGPNYRVLGTGDDQTQQDEQQTAPPARQIEDVPRAPDEQQPRPGGDAPQVEPDGEADGEADGETDGEADDEPEAEPEQ
ncbi:MAG: type II secretion system secretin GspD [Persicimonas sp.]